MALPPVLLELTTSSQPFHRFTPFQLLNLSPTLLVDSVSEPLPVQQLAQILLAGLNDPSVDVRVEAMKALRSIILEGVTAKEREQVGSLLILEAFKVGSTELLGLADNCRRYQGSHQICCPMPSSPL